VNVKVCSTTASARRSPSRSRTHLVDQHLDPAVGQAPDALRVHLRVDDRH
jgi:hypothetical protein